MKEVLSLAKDAAKIKKPLHARISIFINFHTHNNHIPLSSHVIATNKHPSIGLFLLRLLLHILMVLTITI